ncbi:MAG: ParB/RepB/Spo0J family partition protein [Lachnospiraceae bacterium]|nr:ParB/RepB/Spo0J family partition protein [Lachnospiraceae bacterium]
MATKKGLGKGLDTLIPQKIDKKSEIEKKETKEEKENLVEATLKITEVEPNREQPRKKFDEDALIELSESIKQFGILQPLLVQKRDDYYEIIAGERRWRAARMANLKEVPVLIRNYTEKEILEIALIENLQRENLNAIEEAKAYKKLMEEFNMKQDEVAERVSKSRTAVTNSMRLLKLDEKVQQMLIDEMISSGHARALIPIEDKELQYTIALKIFDEKLSVRETEKLIKTLQTEPIKVEKEDKKVPTNDFIYRDLENKMKEIVGSKVTIKNKDDQKGKIEIEYYSQEELERIISHIHA